MGTTATGFRDLTAEEIACVSGGWDYDSAVNLWTEDLSVYGYSVTDDLSGAGWFFDNGGSGWGYYVNEGANLISSFICNPSL